MKIYKVVPYTKAIVIKKKESAQNAVLKFFDVISQECVAGWEFHSVSTVPVTRKLGTFKKSEEIYHAFIFVKDVEDGKADDACDCGCDKTDGDCCCDKADAAVECDKCDKADDAPKAE